MSQPRITVVTTNYNHGRYLERAICSVLDQGYENLEYFVIDGGSTDDSVDIIRLYEGELAGWVSEPDGGPGDAVNKGLARATGDIVAYLASDDVYLPGTLLEVGLQMSGRYASQWLVGQPRELDAYDELVSSSATCAPQSLASYLMHDSGNLPGAASFWHKSLIEANGLFDAEMESGFDYEYACRLLAAGHGPTVIGDAVVARRRVGGGNASDTVRQGIEYITAAQRYAEYLPMAQRYALWMNCDTRRRIYTLAQAEAQNGNGRRYLWQQLARRPWWITSEAVRRALVHGVAAFEPAGVRRAAA